MASVRNEAHGTRAHAAMNAHPPNVGFRARNEKRRGAWSSVAHVESYSQPKSANAGGIQRRALRLASVAASTELRANQNSKEIPIFEISSF